MSSKLRFTQAGKIRTPYQVRESHAAHFITSSIVEWLPVFTSARCCDLLFESFAYCREHKGLLIHARVILDNHFHAIVAGPQLSQTISVSKNSPPAGSSRSCHWKAGTGG